MGLQSEQVRARALKTKLLTLAFVLISALAVTILIFQHGNKRAPLLIIMHLHTHELPDHHGAVKWTTINAFLLTRKSRRSASTAGRPARPSIRERGNQMRVIKHCRPHHDFRRIQYYQYSWFK